MKNPALDADVSAVLRRAAELVSAGWCRFAYARDVHGRGMGSALKSSAVSWCLTGAVYRAAYEIAGEINQSLLDACWQRLRRTLRVKNIFDVVLWNDDPSRTQQEVVEALQRAGRVK